MCKLEYDLNTFNARNKYQTSLLESNTSEFVLSKYDIVDDKMIVEINDEYYSEENILVNKHLNLYEKLIVLYNCLKLNKIYGIYYFSLAPNNIIVLPNLDVKIIIRDIYNDNNTVSFIDQYKSLFACMLDDSYSYVDYLNGGLDLMDKNPISKQIRPLLTADEIESVLSSVIEDEKVDNDNNYTCVKNNWVKRNRFKSLTIILLIILLTGGFVVSGYNYNIQKQIINIQDSYVEEDYSKVLQLANKLKVSQMNNDLLYVVAKSYVNVEVTDAETKSRMQNLITINSDSEILKYFVYLAQNDFKKAQDCAYNIDDKDFMVFAYLKEIDYISNNQKLSANEKQEKINEIESKIEQLGYKLKD